MTVGTCVQNFSSTYRLGDLETFNRESSQEIRSTRYHLIKTNTPPTASAFSANNSLFSLAEAVGRSALNCLAYIKQNTLGCFRQAKTFIFRHLKIGKQDSFDHFSAALESGLPYIQPLKKNIEPTQVKFGSELIADKLQKQFQYAQKQAAQEKDKNFQYLAAPNSFNGHTESEKIADHEVGVCHFIGRRPTMEDEHLATSFQLNVAGVIYPVELFGIFDGHGGGEASRFLRDNLEHKLHETLDEFCANGLSDEAIWNALKITFARIHQEFKERSAGSTATVAIILDGKLWTANVGDSRTILDNGIQLSEDAKPSDPRYRNGIENRGGFVFGDRINGILAVGRAIGDHDVGAINPRPKITAYPLSAIPKGSHLILTCDGIYDVASTKQVAEAVRANRSLSAAELARNIVYSAFEADSQDNLSALVVKL